MMAIEGVQVDGVARAASDRAAELGCDMRLIRAVIEGSQEALAGLYDKHGNGVFAAAMRSSGDRSMAAEVVQDTFLALWNRAELFDPARGTLQAWLTTIARNRVIDRLRAAGRHDRAISFSSVAAAEGADGSIADWLATSGDLIGAGGPDPLPEAALTDKETRASITHALASLGPMERSVIALAYDGGLTQSEIAARLGWPIGTVKTRTRRALRHLREALDGSEASPRARGVGIRAADQGVVGIGRREGHDLPGPVDPGCSGAIAAPCS